MKKHFIYATAVVFVISAVFYGCKNGKNTDKNVTDTFLGTVAFKTSQTWKVGNQEWSDVVMSTGCKKDDFRGYSKHTKDFCADCRQNPNYGDLYSWETVNQYGEYLCPDGWRMPTVDDFYDLDIALGGTGNNQFDSILRDKYLNTWGGSYGGACNSDDSLRNQGSYAVYWSQSENSSDYGYVLLFHLDGGVLPQSLINKDNGFSVRCVR